MGENIFLLVSIFVFASAFWVVFSPSLVHSAVSLMFTLFGVAGLYVFLYADFIAGTQVVIYVGGILVLIIFGVMLTNRIDKSSIAASSQNQFIGGLASVAIFILLVSIIYNTKWHDGTTQIVENTTPVLGKMLLTDYLLPFEIASILLLASLIGAALLARKLR